MKKEYDAMDSVKTRDVSKEYESVLNESKNAASIGGEEDVVKVGDKVDVGNTYADAKPISSIEEANATVDGKK